MAVKFFPVASGSDGNCIYIGTENTHILIDSGMSGKKTQTTLEEYDILGDMIDAIFITHEHQDHIQSVGILSRRFDIPIYATEETWAVIDKDKLIGKILPNNKHTIYYDEPCIIQEMKITPFPIPHDAVEPSGYVVSVEDKKISVVTDIGHITEILHDNIVGSNILLIESNHDVKMVENGPYPHHLKQRILGEYGHLSNENCGKFLADIILNSEDLLKHIFLGHLSNENNTPIIAYDTVIKVLGELAPNTIINSSDVSNEKNINLKVADRIGLNKMIILE